MSEQEIEQQNTVTDDNRMILRTENLVKKYGKRTVVS
ncbi:LPS export ABC transporter ATP-binding protein, partial [Phocaeicola vulgatus]|nr:LPS export ABC transporter ATP-binding protein [Phocaeicola vulgatus]